MKDNIVNKRTKQNYEIRMSETIYKRYVKCTWFWLTAALANRKTANALVQAED